MRVSRGSRWAAIAAAIGAAVFGFGGPASAGTGTIDCFTVRWDGEGTYATLNGARVAVDGSAALTPGVTYYVLDWYGPAGDGSGRTVKWSTTPTTLTAPTNCTTATPTTPAPAVPTTPAAATPTPTPAPATPTSSTVVVGEPTDTTGASSRQVGQRLPETGSNGTLVAAAIFACVVGVVLLLWRWLKRPTPAA